MSLRLRNLCCSFLACAFMVTGCQQSASPTASASTTVAATPGVSGSPSAATLEIVHSKGTTAVPAQPQRLVVFDLSSLDTLDALGVKPLGVAGKIFPKHLEKYAGDEYVKVGTLFEPDYEALNAAKPDLIIVGGRSSAKYEELAKLAPTIDLSVTDNDYIGSSRKNAETIAKIFGKSELVQERLAKLTSSVESLAAQSKDAGKALVILTTGGKMSAYGPGSRFGTLHTDFGFVPAVEKLNTSRHGEPISFEFIAKTNPDWLFVVDRDAAIGEKGKSATSVLDNPLVKGTSAGQKGRIVYLDPANWYLAGGGLAALQAMADEVSSALTEHTSGS